jgi:hypothetical protein
MRQGMEPDPLLAYYLTCLTLGALKLLRGPCGRSSEAATELNGRHTALSVHF